MENSQIPIGTMTGLVMANNEPEKGQSLKETHVHKPPLVGAIGLRPLFWIVLRQRPGPVLECDTTIRCIGAFTYMLTYLQVFMEVPGFDFMKWGGGGVSVKPLEVNKQAGPWLQIDPALCSSCRRVKRSYSVTAMAGCWSWMLLNYQGPASLIFCLDGL